MLNIILTLSLFIISHSLADDISDLDWFQTGCTLQPKNGKRLSFPGYMCIFQEDGSFISVGEKSIRKFSKDAEVLWEVPGSFHHQMNHTLDKKKILSIASEITLVKNKKRRDDSFFLIDQDGKIISKISAQEILKQAGVSPLRHVHFTLGADFESSHFNSIYEIPPNSNEKEVSWLKSGNIIVNSLFLGVFVLSPDLKTLQKHFRLWEFSENHVIHDVQVTPDGSLLFFNNVALDRTKIKFSAIQKIDPRTNKLVFEFSAYPKEMFFSTVAGSVQEMGDHLFFSHGRTGGYLFSKKMNDIVRTLPYVAGETPPWVQEIRLVNVKEFLKNHD